MTYFSVQHGPLEELNGQLKWAVGQMGTILTDLNSLLKNTSEATQGKALPLWQDQQGVWNANYNDMTHKLECNFNASTGVAEIWNDGDYRTGQIMAHGH